jgi:hypothetical protein
VEHAFFIPSQDIVRVSTSSGQGVSDSCVAQVGRVRCAVGVCGVRCAVLALLALLVLHCSAQQNCCIALAPPSPSPSPSPSPQDFEDDGPAWNCLEHCDAQRIFGPWRQQAGVRECWSGRWGHNNYREVAPEDVDVLHDPSTAGRLAKLASTRPELWCGQHCHVCVLLYCNGAH